MAYLDIDDGELPTDTLPTDTLPTDTLPTETLSTDILIEDVFLDLPPAEDTIHPDSCHDVAPSDVMMDLDSGFDGLPLDSIQDLPEDIPQMPAPCCLSDEDCEKIGDGGWTCAWGTMQAENPDWGRCMGPLTWEDGLCWDDGDCPDGQSCEGAAYCPCDMPCGMADFPGQCQDPESLGDVGDLCGPSGGDCKPDLVCCYPCGIPDCQWQCSEPCDSEEPWCSGGCPMVP